MDRLRARNFTILTIALIVALTASIALLTSVFTLSRQVSHIKDIQRQQTVFFDRVECARQISASLDDVFRQDVRSLIQADVSRDQPKIQAAVNALANEPNLQAEVNKHCPPQLKEHT
jgi:Na+-transporting NADH:ubiquinone oxidoreductase subunit NqrC